jgi:hypothetical protein
MHQRHLNSTTSNNPNSQQNPSIPKTLCYVCRTPSSFIPLLARLNPDILAGPITHAFDPCGHVIHQEGARKWGSEILVPRFVDRGNEGAFNLLQGLIGGAQNRRGSGDLSRGMETGNNVHAATTVSSATLGFFDADPVCGPARFTERPRLPKSMKALESRMNSSSSVDVLSKLKGGWCHICPFCSTEIVGVRKLFWATEDDF